MNENDNVAVALKTIRTGEVVIIKDLDKKIEVKQDILYGHKVAIKDITNGDQILKYGECMGIATENIPIGYHVHVHNVRGLNEEERAQIIARFVR